MPVTSTATPFEYNSALHNSSREAATTTKIQIYFLGWLLNLFTKDHAIWLHSLSLPCYLKTMFVNLQVTWPPHIVMLNAHCLVQIHCYIRQCIISQLLNTSYFVLQVMSLCIIIQNKPIPFLLLPSCSGSDFNVECVVANVAMTTPMHKIWSIEV